ncbi:hypothetical protein Bhyg_01529 [Pseudolycoriella hygida]|uniref:Uncharacterized protein n=1 Tax=Pseudolycoriella hygida TaxID=35572 RepID=A0A9Q0NA25_9DIPT|nr:hypothetical protein Bhyg_01529 [Pseudolycoriella hygida]
MIGTEYIEGHNPNITKIWNPPTSECMKSNTKSSFDRHPATHQNTHNTNDSPSHEDENNNIIEGAARSKVSRSSATETMGLSGSSGTDGTYKATNVINMIKWSATPRRKVESEHSIPVRNKDIGSMSKSFRV